MTQRKRFQFKFWLDTNKPDQLELGIALEQAKRVRGYAALIRDALRLFLELKQGNTSLLRSMFPEVVADLSKVDSPANVEFARLIERQTAILERLATQPVHAMLPEQVSAAPKMLTIPKAEASSTLNAGALSALAGSAFVEAAPEDPGEARKNFAAGMGDLFGGDDDDDF